MAREPRSFTVCEGFSVHKVWRGHNREYNLGSADEKQTYLDFLNADLESDRYDAGCELQALTLMNNHSHEVARILKAKAYSNHMRRHHARYGAYFNKRHDRCGKVAQDRPFTSLLQDNYHEMTNVFYIHANPVRAGIVRNACDWNWSTHQLYAFGKRKCWMRNVRLPEWYMRLGRTMKQRQKRYRQLFEHYLMQTGLRRQPRRRFYGEEGWCLAREEAVRQWRREHAPP